jgi:alpha-1,6-mannosyltransferase
VVAPGPRDTDTTLAKDPGLARVVRVAGAALPYDPTYHLLARLDKVRGLVQQEQPDIVEVHSPYLAMAGALALPRHSFGARTFFWHADFIDTYLRVAALRLLPERAVDAALRPVWLGVRALLSACDATFVAGKAQAEKLRALGVPNVHLVPFGVDTATFHPEAGGVARRRELLAGAPDSASVVVGVGRFAVEKRWDIVLDAFERLTAHRQAVLVLFGDGPERKALEERASRLQHVHFAGFETNRERLASALASADLLVHGCPYETFGLGVAEAVACGVPVVVPDQGGACESVDPSTSVVYASLQSDACAAAMESLLCRHPGQLHSAAVLVAKDVRRVQDHFAEVLSVYQTLLR